MEILLPSCYKQGTVLEAQYSESNRVSLLPNLSPFPTSRPFRIYGEDAVEDNEAKYVENH